VTVLDTISWWPWVIGAVVTGVSFILLIIYQQPQKGPQAGLIGGFALTVVACLIEVMQRGLLTNQSIFTILTALGEIVVGSVITVFVGMVAVGMPLAALADWIKDRKAARRQAELNRPLKKP
jgi:hypothetical protein